MSTNDIQSVEVRLARIEEKLENINSNVNASKKILDGNGDPDKGLVTRVARVESTNKVLVWVMAAVASAIIGYIAVGLMDNVSIQKSEELRSGAYNKPSDRS